MLRDHQLKNVRRHQHVTLGAVGTASLAILVTSVTASWAAKSSEFKCRAVHAFGICFDKYRQGTTKSIFLKMRGDGWNQYLPLRAQITSHCEISKDTPTPTTQKPSGVRTFVFDGRPFQTRCPDVFSSLSCSGMTAPPTSFSKSCRFFKEGLTATSYLMRNRSPNALLHLETINL